jgi:hypothetical protein
VTASTILPPPLLHSTGIRIGAIGMRAEPEQSTGCRADRNVRRVQLVLNARRGEVPSGSVQIKSANSKLRCRSRLPLQPETVADRMLFNIGSHVDLTSPCEGHQAKPMAGGFRRKSVTVARDATSASRSPRTSATSFLLGVRGICTKPLTRQVRHLHKIH